MTNRKVERRCRKPPNAINATLYPKLSYNFIRDIAPVAAISRVPNVMVVHPSFSARSVPEFIAYAKANPGRINMASGGIGASDHLAGELFKMLAGVDLVHVPYRGAAPAITDLLAGGRVDVMFATMPPALPHILGGKLYALAVSTATRVDALPNIASINESVPGYEASTWFGLGAPRQTPGEIVEQLNQAVNAALGDPKLKARLAELGAEPMSMTVAAFERFIITETDKWGKVVRSAGLKPDA
jgi:tripartite-type tricarboxylate transporter receptor subunit TctC